jgi:hypothetical protein
MQWLHVISALCLTHSGAHAANRNVGRWQANPLRILTLTLDRDELDAAAGPAGGVAGRFALKHLFRLGFAE